MTKTKSLAFSAIFISIALILSFIKIGLPYGGSVTLCSMLFISLIGYYTGAFWGIMAAIAYGILQFICEPLFLNPIQFLLDYLLGFGVLGVSGFFSNKAKGLVAGFTLGAFLRFICSAISGYVFYGSYAPENMNVIIYTILYNLSYIFPEVIITYIFINLKPFKKLLEEIEARLI